MKTGDTRELIDGARITALRIAPLQRQLLAPMVPKPAIWRLIT